MAIRSCIFGGQREGIRKEGSALKVESVPGKYSIERKESLNRHVFSK